MASVFLYHVVGDLTVGKPELLEFSETETVESAIRAIGESTECGIPVWKRRSHVGMIENNEMRQQRFVGILTSFDIVSFLAKTQCLEDQDKAMKTQASDVVVRNNSLLKVVDPGTRLIDALEMMKHGVRRLLVPKSKVWRGMSKRFSILYNGKWLKNIENGSSNNLIANANPRSSSTASTYMRDKFCCLSREDIIRFLIGCLGALAPLPLSSISSLGAINLNYTSSPLPLHDSSSRIPPLLLPLCLPYCSVFTYCFLRTATGSERLGQELPTRTPPLPTTFIPTISLPGCCCCKFRIASNPFRLCISENISCRCFISTVYGATLVQSWFPYDW